MRPAASGARRPRPRHRTRPGQDESSDAAKALEQIDSLLRDILAREGIQRIDAVGVPFDPTIHDAVGRIAPTPPPRPAAKKRASAGKPVAAPGAQGPGEADRRPTKPKPQPGQG